MAGPRIVIQERDFSTRLTGSSSIIGAIALPALKGPLGPRLVTSDSELLSVYTPNSKVEIGMSQAFYSALEFMKNANSLYVNRVQNEAKYGGIALKSSTATTENFGLSSGLAEPSFYNFDGLPDVVGVAEQTRFTCQDAGSLDGAGVLMSDRFGTVAFWFDVDDDGTAAPAFAGTADRAVKITTVNAADSASDVATKFAFAVSSDSNFTAVVENSTQVLVTDAFEGDRANASAQNSGFLVEVVSEGEVAQSTDDEAVLLYQIDPGAWANSYGVKVYNYDENPEKVKEPGASLIEIYEVANPGLILESWVVSLDPAKIDADNNSIFITTIMEQSAYFRAVANPVIDKSLGLKTQASILASGGGDDGMGVTDAQMIQALDAFSNTSEVSITAVMDGGNATPAYQQAIAQLCESRGDCKGFLSVPYQLENDSDPLSSVIDYRQNTFGASSSWVEMYTPHVKIFDKFNNREIFISPEGLAASKWAQVTENDATWFTIAGKKRGQVLVQDLLVRFNEAQVIALNSAGINPIMSEPGQGFFIFGNRTLLARPSKLQSSHVRSLLVWLRPRIKQISSTFQFDFNDDITRASYTDLVSRVFQEAQAGRGIEAYAVKCDEENNPPAIRDQQKLILRAAFAPINVAEEIIVTLALSNSGAVEIDIAA